MPESNAVGPTPRPPVVDWATDFDHLSDEWAQRAPEITADLRRRCPIAHTERFHGAYLATRYDDIVHIAQDTRTFSSRVTMVNDNHPDQIRFDVPPISLDPPAHGPVRRALLPLFSPNLVEGLVPFVTDVAQGSLDRLAGREMVDGATDFAEVIPTEVTARLLGFPAEEGGRFRGWVDSLVKEGQSNLALAARTTKDVYAYFAGQIEERRLHPTEDLVTWVTTATVTEDGVTRPLSSREQLGILYLLLVGGIDTTWSVLGASLFHLATHAADLGRLVAEPDLLPTAVEEFLRYYSPVTIGRVIEADTEVGGCLLRAGERILMNFGSANRDPDVFQAPDEFVLDRQINRHLTFGSGVHRCLGSNLARMELRVALAAWLERYPRFELVGDVRWTPSPVRGPRNVPIRILR